MATQNIPEVREANLLARAALLLHEQRLQGRRLNSSDLRTITSVNKLIISKACDLIIQNQTAVIAFETELELALDNLKKSPR